MQALLFIPWFRAEPWLIPIPEIIPGVKAIPIQPFGVLVAMAVLVGWRMSEWKAKRSGVAPDVASEMVGHVVLGSFVCAHMLDAIFYHPDKIAENPFYLFQLWNGLSSYGGFIGAVIGLLVWKWRRGLPAISIGDAAAFGFPFGWIFGRLGCFVVHDHPGVVTDFPLAVADYRLCIDCMPGPPRHDLGLYEVFWSIAVSALFLLLARKERRRGFYLALVGILYAPIRFGLDFLRAPAADGGDLRYFGLTPGHYGSILLLGVGAWLMYYIHARPEAELPPWARVRPDGADGEKAPKAL